MDNLGPQSDKFVNRYNEHFSDKFFQSEQFLLSMNDLLILHTCKNIYQIITFSKINWVNLENYLVKIYNINFFVDKSKLRLNKTKFDS